MTTRYEITTRTITTRAQLLRVDSPVVQTTLYDVTRDGVVVAEGCRSYEEAETERAQLEAGDRLDGERCPVCGEAMPESMRDRRVAHSGVVVCDKASCEERA
jgi:hypothetical protein